MAICVSETSGGNPWPKENVMPTPPAADATPDNVATPGAKPSICPYCQYMIREGAEHCTCVKSVRARAEWRAHIATIEFAEDPGPPPNLVTATVSVATPRAGGAGDVTEAVHDVIREMRSAMADLKRDLKTLVAERDALRAAIPFPGMDASNADAIAFHFERDGWSGLTNEATAAWLRSMANNLRAFEAALARVPAAEKAPGPAGQGDGGRE